MTPAVSINSVRKDFGDFTAISEVSFEIADNEFFTLLGPSGCGKTTLLRMIAGFENTTAGTIHLYGDEIEALPPNKRPVNTVFQNYALFPHMSVTENIGFGLKMLGWSNTEIENRVNAMVEMVQLQQFVHRKPGQLSGGQQQRVALARAMAPKPKVLLLDEPLSALDLKLRQEMRKELKRLQQDTGITFIFVTHDQEEALSMSDRIAVMSAGNVQQVGTPAEIYEHPSNRFVADFIGETNLLDAIIESISGNETLCSLSDGAELKAVSSDKVSIGQSGTISLRPERLSLSAKAVKGETLKGVIGAKTYLGTDSQVEILLGENLSLTARMQNSATTSNQFNQGQSVYVKIAEGAAQFLAE